MRIVYVYRCPKMGYSIQRSFNAIENEIKKRKNVEVDSIYFDNTKFSLNACVKNVIAVIKYARKHPHTIIHLTGAEYYILPFLRRYKTVVTVHDLGFYLTQKNPIKKFFLYLMYVKTIEAADMVVYVSKKSEEEGQKYLNISNYCTIWNSISDINIVPPLNHVFNVDCPRILFVGTKANKNLRGFIHALKGRNCHLRIIGPIDDEIKDLLLKYNIHYSQVQDLSDSEIIIEYQICDFVAFPSLYEGFGLPILEGQCAGKAVLTSNRSPMKEIAGESCVLVDPCDVDSMREGINTIISNHKLYEESGKENVKKYSLERKAEEYYDVYCHLTI